MSCAAEDFSQRGASAESSRCQSFQERGCRAAGWVRVISHELVTDGDDWYENMWIIVLRRATKSMLGKKKKKKACTVIHTAAGWWSPKECLLHPSHSSLSSSSLFAQSQAVCSPVTQRLQVQTPGLPGKIRPEQRARLRCSLARHLKRCGWQLQQLEHIHANAVSKSEQLTSPPHPLTLFAHALSVLSLPWTCDFKGHRSYCLTDAAARCYFAPAFSIFRFDHAHNQTHSSVFPTESQLLWSSVETLNSPLKALIIKWLVV